MADTSPERPFAVSVRGLGDTARLLREIEPTIPRRVLPAAGKRVGSLVERAAEREVPVLSGELKSTIRTLAAQRRVRVAAGYARTPYAGVIHYGWPQRGIPADPFLHRALSIVGEDRISEQYERALDVALAAAGL